MSRPGNQARSNPKQNPQSMIRAATASPATTAFTYSSASFVVHYLLMQTKPKTAFKKIIYMHSKVLKNEK